MNIYFKMQLRKDAKWEGSGLLAVKEVNQHQQMGRAAEEGDLQTPRGATSEGAAHLLNHLRG